MKKTTSIKMKEHECFHGVSISNNLPNLKVLTIIIHYCLWNFLIHLASLLKPYGKEPQQVSGKEFLSCISHKNNFYTSSLQFPQAFENVQKHIETWEWWPVKPIIFRQKKASNQRIHFQCCTFKIEATESDIVVYTYNLST